MTGPLYRGSIRGDYKAACSNARLKTVVVGRSARLVRASAYVAWERGAGAQLRAGTRDVSLPLSKSARVELDVAVFEVDNVA